MITLSQVLEHVKRPGDLVQKVRRWLVPGGLIHVDVPNHASLAGWPSRIAGGLGTRFGAIEWPHHAFAYDHASLAHVLRAHFRAEIFAATPDDPLWGQAKSAGVLSRAYYLTSRVLCSKSLVVGYGPRR